MNGKKIMFFLVLVFVLASCGKQSVEPTEPAISQEDTLNTAIAGVMGTANANAAQTAAVIPTQEQETATSVPTESVSQTTGKEYAWNYLGSQDVGGVVVTVARVLIADVGADEFYKSIITSEAFINKPVLGEILFVIENKTPGKITIFTNQGLVLVGSEQISLLDYAIEGLIEEYSGDVLPGAKIIGGTWFGIERTTVDEINSMTINFSAPFDSNMNRLGTDYNFVLDLSQKQFAEMPEELK